MVVGNSIIVEQYRHFATIGTQNAPHIAPPVKIWHSQVSASNNTQIVIDYFLRLKNIHSEMRIKTTFYDSKWGFPAIVVVGQ